MSMFRRACAVLVTALALILVAAPGASAHAPAHRKAPQLSYVALGDSYAAGVGAAPATDTCGRSALAYPRLIATAARLNLTLAACTGATMADVASKQLASVGASASYVTVQAGGNDIGFTEVFGLCARPDNDADCAAAVALSKAYLNSDFATNAGALFTAIRARAPRARVIVVGYPRLFSGKNCSTLVEYTAAEQRLMNGAIDLLNTRLAQAASAVGARFANPTGAFTNHAWCAKRSWINGPESAAAFHPNARGQLLGYAPTVGRKFL